ncbi:MAG: kelch repeat-containing protein [Planctomycetota bacterium]
MLRPLALLALSSCLAGQPGTQGWIEPQPFGPAALNAAGPVFDADGRLMLYTENLLIWRWDGHSWHRSDTTGPWTGGSVEAQRLVFDARRGCSVLFTELGETWELPAGAPAWVQRPTSVAPPAGPGCAMAFDDQRGVVLLFGGSRSYGVWHNETWEWDGTAWTQRTPAASPSPRGNHAMAFDSQRGRILLFGGQDAAFSDNDETWAWDGATWTRLTSPQTPSPRAHHAMAYDRARDRVVLYAGQTAIPGFPLWGTLRDLWEWDGTAWTQAPLTTEPGNRSRHGMTYDAARQRVVLFGGLLLSLSTALWEWDGTTWVQTYDIPDKPGPRTGVAMAADPVRQRLVMYGGLTFSTFTPFVAYDTLEWDGTTWVDRQRSAPGPRRRHAMAWDPAGGGVLLHGGLRTVLSTARLRDTWRWDGARWTQADTAGPRTEGHAMVADEARQRVVLFGGGPDTMARDETWLWDGARWEQRTPATSPPARTDHVMGYDRARSRVVVFGGRTDVVSLADTWEWDGTNWELRDVASGPPPLAEGMVFDEARQRLLMTAHPPAGHQTWEWDGSTWTELQPWPRPTALTNAILGYDPRRQTAVMLRGTGETHVWTEARTRTTGPACAASTGIVPALEAFGLPWLGNPSLAVDVTADASTPLVYLIGAREIAAPIGGCTLSVDPTPPIAAIAAGTNAYGRGTLRLPLQIQPLLVGASLHLQALLLDRGAPFGFAASNGLAFDIGR